MKKFLAMYLGSPGAPAKMEISKEQEKAGMEAWMKWGNDNAKSIADNGAPLGKTKRVDKSGISDVRNAMAAYTFVNAETHEDAAKLFLNHPHFTIFPGEAVEIMECLPMPEMPK